MSEKLFQNGRQPEQVAYDLALVLASRDADIKTAKELLKQVKIYYPECLSAAQEMREQEIENPITNISVTFPC